ncbi:MAG TPA: hypothetical protein VFJ16_22370 [Longimicrobium sp.]|nr:hypothetical protein [Longimicrobium sp.]
MSLQHDVQDFRELELTAESCLLITDEVSGKILKGLSLGAEARVEEGSLEIVAIILASVASLVSFISGYGDLSEGLHKLAQDAECAAKLIRERILRVKKNSPVKSTSISSADLAMLHRLVDAVSNGQMDHEKAARSALEMLTLAGEESDETTKKQLMDLFASVQLRPENQRLPAASDDRRRINPSFAHRRKGVLLRREPHEKIVTIERYLPPPYWGVVA